MSAVDHQVGSSRLAAKVIGKIIRAAGTQTLLREVALEMIGAWAEKGPIRTRLASPARWAVSKVFRPGGNGSAQGIPDDVGSLITEFAREVNAGHVEYPAPRGSASGEAIGGFLRNTDFGEIREMVEGSDPHILGAVRAFNDELWKYPAKVGAIVATMIPLANTSLRVLREALAPIEKAIGPDLLADILLSVVKGIHGKDAAKLANSLQEVLRRVHTGSLLLGKGGKPLFQIYLTDLLRDFLPELDPELLKKARIALAEDREACANALADALSSSPDAVLAFLSTLGQVKSSDIRARSRRLRVMEDIDGEGLKSALAESTSSFDTYEAAGLVNTLCRVANRIHGARPDIVSSLVSGITDSIDPEEIRETARWLIPDLVEAMGPIAREVMPQLVLSLSGLMRPEDGCASPDRDRAVQALREALAVGGES